MVTRTRDVSTRSWIVFRKPDKRDHYMAVTSATDGLYSSWRSLPMCLFSLGEAEDLAEGWDRVKIIVAITASRYLYE